MFVIFVFDSDEKVASQKHAHIKAIYDQQGQTQLNQYPIYEKQYPLVMNFGRAQHD